jgi:hypothetical protein
MLQYHQFQRKAQVIKKKPTKAIQLDQKNVARAHKYNYDWETGVWINKDFIYDFENEWLVKTSRKRKNK